MSCGITHPFGCVVGAVSSDVISQIASDIQSAEADMIGSLSSLWTNIPTPTVGSTTTGQPVGAVAFLWNSTSWLVGVFAVLGLLIAAGRMAWHRKSEPLQEALHGLVNLVLVSGCAVAGVELAVQSGDAFSSWILDYAVGVQPGSQFTQTGASAFDTDVKNIADLSQQGLATMVVIVLGLLAIISCIVQTMLMIVRYAMLGLLVGMLPVTASISGMQSGKTIFRKNVGWLLSFVLYKPVAAIVYAYAIVAMKADSVISEIAGVSMIAMACVALPALMRFVNPMVAGVTGGGGGAGAALAGAGVAAGARIVSSNSSGSAGGGDSSGAPSGNSSAPSGAQIAGSQGSGGGSGSPGQSGPGGASGAGGGQAAGSSGSSAAATGSSGSAGAAGAAGSSGAAGAAAAAGPVGMAAAAGMQAAGAVKQGIANTAQGATGEGGGGDS